jgi:hypothetical protein
VPTNNGSGDSGFVSLSVAPAIKKLTGAEIEKMLSAPNINLCNIPECRKYLAEGSH